MNVDILIGESIRELVDRRVEEEVGDKLRAGEAAPLGHVSARIVLSDLVLGLWEQGEGKVL